MVGSSLAITSTSLAGIIPDGVKILSMKVSNVTGRRIAIEIPGSSGLVTNDGGTGSLNQTMSRVAFAPLSRFPVLKVQIPDLVADSQDTNGTGVALFTLSTDGPTDRVVIHFHYKQAI